MFYFVSIVTSMARPQIKGAINVTSVPGAVRVASPQVVSIPQNQTQRHIVQSTATVSRHRMLFLCYIYHLNSYHLLHKH